MNHLGQHSRTFVLEEHVAPAAPFAITPVRLADLMLAGPIAHSAGLVSLEPGGDLSTLSIQRGSYTIAELHVLADVATAAITRIALVAGLDPLADTRSWPGNRNVGRARIRVGPDVAEVLVTVGASPEGLRAEVHPLSINGRSTDLRMPAQLLRCTACHAYQALGQQVCEVDGSPLVEVEDLPKPGGTIGVYRVLRSLGAGTGGMVFAAEHALLGRPAAIKVLQRNLASDPGLTHRFLSEARAASRLHHPNVVDVTDFGVLQDGRPYMVMERLAGESLQARLSRTGALTPETALRTAREIAVALGAAHDAGIVHNDVKPSNVILLEGSTDQVPRLKLIDFGAASRAGTSEEVLLGTPRYMAPERVLGEPSDGRADLYSLGVVLHEMLAGHAPFTSTDLAELLLAQVRSRPPAPRSPFGVLPRPVTRLLARALAKQPELRHPTAADLVDDLDGALAAVGREGFRRWLP